MRLTGFPPFEASPTEEAGGRGGAILFSADHSRKLLWHHTFVT